LPAGTASSPVVSMTSGQLQMLQGLVMANSTDGSGRDANSAALVSALQEMGTGNTTPGHGTSSVPATPAAGRSNTVSATGGTDSRSDNVSSRSLNPGTQQGFASPTVGSPRQMFVAFAFSPL